METACTDLHMLMPSALRMYMPDLHTLMPSALHMYMSGLHALMSSALHMPDLCADQADSGGLTQLVDRSGRFRRANLACLGRARAQGQGNKVS